MRIYVIPIILILSVSLLIQAQDQHGFLSIDGQVIPDYFFIGYLNKQHSIVNSETDKKTVGKSLEDYILYRLKINEAEKTGLDTSSSFIREYNDFKLARIKTLLDYSRITEESIKEFYEHYCYEIKIGHIQVNLHPLPLPSDTLHAFNKIWEIYNLILNGMSFEDAAKEYSENPVTRLQNGTIGYIGASILTFPMEDIAYNTLPGKYSPPIRIWNGYQIIKVYDKRPARGSILVAQIRKSIPRGAGDSLIQHIKGEMDSILDLLHNGANFSRTAMDNSDDVSTADGGVMPWIRTGMMDETFTETAFSLENDGDLSPVIRSKEGYHIIKRLGLKTVPTYDEMKPELVEILQSHTSRSRYLREKLIGRIRIASNCIEDEESIKEFFSYAATSFDQGHWKEPQETDLNRILFTYSNDTVRQKDFSHHLLLDRYPYRVRDYEIRIRQYYRDYLENKLLAFAEIYPDIVFPELNRELMLFRQDKLYELLNQQKTIEFSENIEEKLPVYFENNRKRYKKENDPGYKSFDEAFEDVLKDYYAEKNESWEKELKRKYHVSVNKKAFKGLFSINHRVT